MPLEATQHTPEGARAFAEFFIKTIDWGYATTSSTYMRHYFQKSCIECANVVEGIDRVRNAHEHFVGDRFTIIRSAATKAHSAGLSESLVWPKFNVSSGEIVTSQGKFVDGDAAHPGYQEEVTLRWSDNAWTVTRMVPHP